MAITRKALVVGINNYQHISALYGCANDARDVSKLLGSHFDGSVNFGIKLILGTESDGVVFRHQLREAIKDLFAGKGEVALLYFSGHGHIEMTGGYLCAGDCQTGDDGVPLSEVMTFANKSEIANRIVILDSCHSGIAGVSTHLSTLAEVSEGVTVLTASTAEQYAIEQNGSGLFTGLLMDALRGAASNLVGDVTPGSVYSHVDESLGPWAQRPMFKTNVRQFISLRKVRPPIEPSELRRISELFPIPEFDFSLSPEFEPYRFPGSKSALPPPDPGKTAIFALLQKYNRLNLLVPVGAEHMYYAAMNHRSCRLTETGEHYRNLAAKGLI